MCAHVCVCVTGSHVGVFSHAHAHVHMCSYTLCSCVSVCAVYVITCVHMAHVCTLLVVCACMSLCVCVCARVLSETALPVDRLSTLGPSGGNSKLGHDKGCALFVTDPRCRPLSGQPVNQGMNTWVREQLASESKTLHRMLPAANLSRAAPR